MTLFAPRRHARPAAVRLTRIVPVAAFLLVAACSDRAEASCGDWLAGHEATQGQQAAEKGNAPAAPCDGPLCRRNRDGGPAVPPAPTRQLEQSDRWCRLAEELADRPPLSSSLPPEAAPTLAEGFAPRVDRPPRA